LQKVEDPFDAFEEHPSMRRAPAVKRVEEMFEQVKSKLPGAPKFLLCVLAERKNSDIYGWLFFFLLTSVAYFLFASLLLSNFFTGPWKKKCLAEFGIVTQCVAPPPRVNDQYLTNVLLKINAKVCFLCALILMVLHLYLNH